MFGSVRKSINGTVFFLSTLILLLSNAIAQEATFDGNTYQFVEGEVSWDFASAACSDSGGYLVTVTSQEENNFLISLADGRDAWSGGKQPLGQSSPSTGWQWVTGETWSFTNWHDGEPNDNNNIEGDEEPVAQENCLEFRTDGSWNDDECVDPHNYVCETTGPSALASEKPIPTLAQWAMVSLVMLFGIIGVTRLRSSS